MFVDLHVHERTHSGDSWLSLEEMAEKAKQRGLGALCVTDHDTLGLVAEAEVLTHRFGIPVLVGVEVLTVQGDIIAYGSPYAFPPRTIDAQAFIDYVHAAGGVCFGAHPFRKNRRGLETHLEKLEDLDGLEVLNGGTPMAENYTAFQYAERLGLQQLASSDAHSVDSFGKYATWLPEHVYTVSELIQVLRSGQCRPAIWQDGAYRVVERHDWSVLSDVAASSQLEQQRCAFF